MPIKVLMTEDNDFIRQLFNALVPDYCAKDTRQPDREVDPPGASLDHRHSHVINEWMPVRELPLIAINDAGPIADQMPVLAVIDGPSKPATKSESADHVWKHMH